MKFNLPWEISCFFIITLANLVCACNSCLVAFFYFQISHFLNFCCLLLYVNQLVYYCGSLQEGLWCIGWQNSGRQSRDRMNLTLLGGIAQIFVYFSGNSWLSTFAA